MRTAENLATGLATGFVLTLISVALMLTLVAPELGWDAAHYAPGMTNSWGALWNGTEYQRHGHGPMAIYLMKLGREALPETWGSLETRLRFFPALAGSTAAGLMYWVLRSCFGASAIAGLVGSGLLLFSVIRVEETPAIGPHHLTLASLVLVAGYGYRWLDAPTWRRAVALGCMMGAGALAMTYALPLAVCWALAGLVAGGRWIRWERGWRAGVSRWLVLVPLVACGVVLAFWPPGLLKLQFFQDFVFLMKFGHHPTLLGDRIYEVTPRWATAYWLADLDAPILVFCTLILGVALWRSRGGRLSAKHRYLGVYLGFLLTVMATAHLAGSRNVLQFVGVMCLMAGALFDEALADRQRGWAVAALVVVLAASAGNLAWNPRRSMGSLPVESEGYRALLREEGGRRLRERASALVFGVPVLQFYARELGGPPVEWDMAEVPWTTRTDVRLGEEVRYVLMPPLVYRHMPAGHPMRRVAERWLLVWEAQGGALRLYQRPPG